jgi:hypothetical protein
MAPRSERRYSARLSVPSQVRGRDRARQLVHLVDLSREGARIEHADPLNTGLLCFIDLPPALGRGTLSGRIVWTRLHRDEQELDGARQRTYRSGLSWTGLTPPQQATLTAALQRLQAAWDRPLPE